MAETHYRPVNAQGRRGTPLGVPRGRVLPPAYIPTYPTHPPPPRGRPTHTPAGHTPALGVPTPGTPWPWGRGPPLHSPAGARGAPAPGGGTHPLPLASVRAAIHSATTRLTCTRRACIFTCMLIRYAAIAVVAAASLAFSIPANAQPIEDDLGWSCVDDGNRICGPGNGLGLPPGEYGEGGVMVTPWDRLAPPSRGCRDICLGA